jgi:hypothetical protein
LTAPSAPTVAVGATGLAAHAAALQSILADLGTVTVQQLVHLFRQYSGAPDFPAVVKQAFPGIVTPHAHAAAAITAQWYDELAPGFHATPAVDLPAARLEKTLNWALYAPTKPQPAQPDIPAPVSAPEPAVTLERLAGSAKRMVMDASRDTVVDNAVKQDFKWARYASANACAFCRLMATRGPVYASERSATKVVGRGPAQTTKGTRKLGESYHDHCRCIAVPVPDGETYTPPDYTSQWEQDYLAARKAGNRDAKSILAHMRANTDAS